MTKPDSSAHGFDWVFARHACTPAVVFDRLRSMAERDVAVRNGQLQQSPDPHPGFALDAEGSPDHFGVWGSTSA